MTAPTSANRERFRDRFLWLDSGCSKLALPEVLYLQESEPIDAVIIGADVEEQEEKVKQLRGIVLCCVADRSG